MDSYVAEAIANGAMEYARPEDDDDDDYGGGVLTDTASAFNMTPYEKPQAPGSGAFSGNIGGMGSGGAPSGVALPPGGGGYDSAMGGGPAAPSVDPNNGEPQLVLRGNVANVWGKGGMNSGGANPPALTAPAQAPHSGGFGVAPPMPAPASSWSQPVASAAPEPVVKTEEQLKKERMAAALFGGVVPGAPTSPPSTAAPVPRVVAAAPTLPPMPAPAPPAPAPAPAPEIDLLDMTFDAPAQTPATVAATPDVFTAAPEPVRTMPEPAASPEPAPAPPPAPAEPVDPFAAEGLLGDVTNKPLSNFMSAVDQNFEYGGQKMVPLLISTAEFGGKWGSCPAMSPLSCRTAKVGTLESFMDLCASIGTHNVEAIAATNEGINAGMIGGSIMVLIHGKVAPQSGGVCQVDVAIKSTDPTLGGVLAMYMQNMM